MFSWLDARAGKTCCLLSIRIYFHLAWHNLKQTTKIWISHLNFEEWAECSLVIVAIQIKVLVLPWEAKSVVQFAGERVPWSPRFQPWPMPRGPNCLFFVSKSLKLQPRIIKNKQQMCTYVCVYTMYRQLCAHGLLFLVSWRYYQLIANHVICNLRAFFRIYSLATV